MSAQSPKKLTGRKLLGATIGLAAVSLVGCQTTTGNLVIDTGSLIDAPPPDAPSVQDASTAQDAPTDKGDAGP